MIKRRVTRTVDVGGVKIGSEYPVSIQSMAKTDTVDVEATVSEIVRLEKAGCELVRVAVKTPEAARALSQIKGKISIPLIADIHFDYKLALESVKNGADKIRINPGNIRDLKDLDKIIDVCGEKRVPIRVGVNSGSLTEMHTGAGNPADIMVSSLLKYLELFRTRRFKDVVISLKSSNVRVGIDAYRKMANECDYPFHVGITAAGLPDEGIVRSSIGIGVLLLEGIGDTIRVSLTGEPVGEVLSAKNILKTVGARNFGPEIIACPTCGRCQVDLVSITKKLQKELKKVYGQDKPLLIAVMGCEVNGPGEAEGADAGIAFGKGKGAIFCKGEIVKTVDEDAAVEELLAVIRKGV